MRIFVIVVSLFLLPNLAMSEEYELAIRNVTVVDAASTPRPSATVYLAGDKIALIEVGPSEHSATHSIDGTGKYLVPGLWDMHVHIVYEPELIEAMPRLFLDYGITSVRDTGALLEEIRPEVKRWEMMGVQAPELFFSGPLMDGELVVYNGEGRSEIGVSNPSVKQALNNFEELRAEGVHFIKIYELVSPEVFEALVDAASEAGLPIAAHVPLSMRADTAGPKVGSMEHLRNIEIACSAESASLHATRRKEIDEPGEKSGYELRRHLHQTQRTVALDTVNVDSEKCLAVLQTLKNTIQVPTIRLNTITKYSPLKRGDWQEHLNQIPEAVSEKWLSTARMYAGQGSGLGLAMSDWSMQLVAKMTNVGVPIGAGTDTPIGQAIPGYSLHTELERLVEAGLTPRQALAAATIRPAEFFSREDEMGLIEVGMEADLLLLQHNPLDDIRHTRSILRVISDGRIVR